ncbi:MAG: acyl dehydratase [Candidatus Binataceae bacterium]|jgi:hydroxyacyl-ACP dehydratase HTD2-like protein with hotdog domain
MAGNQLFFEDVTVGAAVLALVKHPTNAQLFRFSAMTWNSHRIHYDKVYAQSEGYPDVLVQSHLHGCFLLQAVMDWVGPRARVLGFRWQNRGIAIPGDVLTCSGKVIKAEGGIVECELEERNQKGDLCAPGWARVELPKRR